MEIGLYSHPAVHSNKHSEMLEYKYQVWNKGNKVDKNSINSPAEEQATEQTD